MANRSSDREKKALQDEISYLSRLIDRHQRMSKPRGGAQMRASNRYTKVNAHDSQARSIVSSPRNFASVHGAGAPSTTCVGNVGNLCSRTAYAPTVQRTPPQTSATYKAPTVHRTLPQTRVTYNAPTVHRTSPQTTRRRSLSTVVHKSRYTLKKLHPGTTSTQKPVQKSTGVFPKTAQGTSLAIGTNTPPAHYGSVRQASAAGKYVYCRKNTTNGSGLLDTRTVTLPTGSTGRTPRQLSSTYKLVRNKSKVATPLKSPSSNLTCIGAKRIVKKYKVNNVNRSRTSQQRPLRSQYGNCAAASKGKQSWPPSYSTTHYFHGQRRKISGKPTSSAGSSQAHYIKIGNITYKASRNKLSRTFKRSLSCSPVSRKAFPRHERVLAVRGSVYMMDAAGKVLRRISQPLCNSEQTNGRTRIDVGGKTYIERKPGVLSQTPSAETRTYLNRTVNRSIHRVRNVDSSQKLKQKSYCMFFNRFGRCNKGDKCAYIHDPEKVAVCTRFLRGTCRVSDCPFSHKIAPEKMPVCSFFLKGRCTNDPCPYRHVKVSSKAAVCKDFAVRGYCADGIKCKKQHILICPEYATNKKCPRGNKCYLSHRVRGTKRKHEENSSEGATEDSSMPAVPLKAPKERQVPLPLFRCKKVRLYKLCAEFCFS
ncbi:zinc finger CCCH domain-containing protein 3 [Rhipicephalus sanguineus]|uniref:zinc finger CCCH domain-containing protein 3 n=1 Tax=Rhipicephalus sanguineus TaxID=34632 RepID=UPI0020C1C9F8|nr:zinc finger CCCH domain-containing protein 3 [Rhipicephalus sanguineus]XP_049267072.1 zinc finger CCCH domain-containing protein 3 [Rhipicephalus sanguineus]